MTAQITAIFLMRRRRFFASICCLYLSGRYAPPKVLGFLFTSTASDDYLIIIVSTSKKGTEPLEESCISKRNISGLRITDISNHSYFHPLRTATEGVLW